MTPTVDKTFSYKRRSGYETNSAVCGVHNSAYVLFFVARSSSVANCVTGR